MPRKIEKHATRLAAEAAGSPYGAFQVGGRVKTFDGFAGRVDQVQDGPVPGMAQFHVILDNGMGGGWYSAAQLRPLADGASQQSDWHYPAGVTASLGEAEASEIRTAASDYPELGDILTERPDPQREAFRVIASRKTAVPLPHSQLKLFHQEHTPRDPAPLCARCGFPARDPDHEEEHTAWREKHDPDYFKNECEHCGGNLDAPRRHAEQHNEWLQDQDWYTDWQAEGPGDTLHRGIAMKLPHELHEHVHDEHQPVEHRARALLNHVLHKQTEGSPHGGLGNFWSDDPDVSKSYAENTNVYSHYQDETRHQQQTPVMLHVHTPGMEHIETDPDQLEHWGVHSFHKQDNREVPVQNQAPLRIKGISWAKPDHGLSKHAWSGVPEKLDEDPAWVHHEFGGEGIRAHAHYKQDDPYDSDDPDSHNYGWCHTCKEHHSDQQEAEDHFSVATDWRQTYKRLPSRMHRGFAMQLPAGLHEHIHDPDTPVAERANMLNDHLQHYWSSLGTHWTPDQSQAEHYADVSSYHRKGSYAERNPGITHVVLHAAKPRLRDIERDPYELHESGVLGYDLHDDQEIPLQSGAPVKVHGLSWKRDDQDAYTHHQFRPGQHHQATSINGQQIDDHGDAPEHGAIPRAGDPDSYDAKSTEGEGDPVFNSPLPPKEKRTREQNGAEVGMYPENVSAGDGPALSIGPYVGARPLRYFHVTNAPNREAIGREGLRPARELFPDEFEHLEDWDSAGDHDYTWFHGLPEPPRHAGSDTWELTHPHLYDLDEDSNYENGAQNPFYRTTKVSPEHLRLVHTGSQPRTWYAAGPAGLFSMAAAGDWYHGSDHPEQFSRFDFSKRRVAQDDDDQERWWNSRLGAHFSSVHEVARDVARNRDDNGNVYHVHLGIKNPKVYPSEHDLAREGGNWAAGQGYRLDPQDIALGHWDDALKTHPRSQEIADRFRGHLQRQGYDGIHYGNEYEEPKGHTCAIAFHPDQVKIHEAHQPYEGCSESTNCPTCGKTLYPGDEACFNCDPHKYFGIPDSSHEGSITPYAGLSQRQGRVPWTDHERTDLHSWQSGGPGIAPGDFVNRSYFTNKQPVTMEAPEPEEDDLMAEGALHEAASEGLWEYHLRAQHGWGDAQVGSTRNRGDRLSDMHEALHDAGLANHEHGAGTQQGEENRRAFDRHMRQQHEVENRFGKPVPDMPHQFPLSFPGRGGRPADDPLSSIMHSRPTGFGDIEDVRQGTFPKQFLNARAFLENTAAGIPPGLDKSKKPDDGSQDDEGGGLDFDEPGEKGGEPARDAAGELIPGQEDEDGKPIRDEDSLDFGPGLPPMTEGSGAPAKLPPGGPPMLDMSKIPAGPSGPSDPDDQDDSGEPGGEDDQDEGDGKPEGLPPGLARMRIAAAMRRSPSLAFHITASWRDVQAKAKRLQKAGRVRITAAKGDILIGEVGGDHDVYESGMQLVPGRRLAAMAWSCGCPWASFHQDSSMGTRFAGRPCSHVTALRFEAQSRIMNGKELQPDPSIPDWLGYQVVVKSMPPWGPGGWAQTWRAPSTISPLAALHIAVPLPHSQLKLFHMDREPGPGPLHGSRSPVSWDSIGERYPHLYGDPEVHGEAADGADGEGVGWAANQLANDRPEDPDAENSGSWDLDFHREQVDPRHIDYARHGRHDPRVQEAYEGYAHGRGQVPPVVLVHRHGVYQVADGHHRAEGASLAGKPVDAYVHYSEHEDAPFSDEEQPYAPFHGAEPHPGIPSHRDFFKHHGAANDPWGDDNYAQHAPQKPYGATSPPEKDKDPGSYGFLSGPDPENWGEINEGSVTQSPAIGGTGALHASPMHPQPDPGAQPGVREWLPERQESFPYADQANSAGPSTSIEARDPGGIRMEEALKIAFPDRKAAAKVSKESVNYRPASGKQRCGNCVMFRPGSCTLVEGKIEAGDTCDRWAPEKTASLTTDDFQDRGEPVRQRMGIDGTAGDAMDVPHRFERDGQADRCLACGMGHGFKAHACSCCGGTGEHPTGHECYKCDASGQENMDPFCERVFRDPELHDQGCPNCGPHPLGSQAVLKIAYPQSTEDFHHRPDDSRDWVHCSACGYRGPSNMQRSQAFACPQCGEHAIDQMGPYEHVHSVYAALGNEFDPAHPDLEGMREVARNTPDFDTFLHNHIANNYHGRYWHLTNKRNFKVDPSYSPREMSSMAGDEENEAPGLQVSTDPRMWHSMMRGRPYAAEIELHGEPGKDYANTTRGFGHEIYVHDPSKAKVLGTYPVGEALRRNDHFYDHVVPQTEEDLRKVWDHARGSVGSRSGAGTAQPSLPGEPQLQGGLGAEKHDEPEGALDPEGLTADDGMGAHIPPAGGYALDAQETGGGPGMSPHDEDLSPSDTSIQTMGQQNYGGDDSLADEAIPGPEHDNDGVIAAFQRSAAGRQFTGDGSAPGDSDIVQAAREHLRKTADVLPEKEAAELIAEGRGQRARNLDLLVLEGTHYAGLDDQAAGRGLSLDDYDDDVLVV